MKRIATPLIVAALLVLLLAACSRHGVHMSKHRKSRHCDCPTFGLSQPADTNTIAYNAQ